MHYLLKNKQLKELNKNKQSSTTAVPYGNELARLPGGVSGPAQGPYTPVKNYGSGYMPDGTEPGVPAPLPMKVQRSPGSWLTAMVMPVPTSNA